METDAYVFHEKILELQSERIKQMVPLICLWMVHNKRVQWVNRKSGAMCMHQYWQYDEEKHGIEAFRKDRTDKSGQYWIIN